MHLFNKLFCMFAHPQDLLIQILIYKAIKYNYSKNKILINNYLFVYRACPCIVRVKDVINTKFGLDVI